MIKKFIYYFFIFVFVTILSGCTTKKSSAIKFATWGSASEIKILKPVIKDFEAKNPDIKIELMHIPQNYFQKIHLLFASNLAPDVIFINNLNIPIFADYLEILSVDKSKYYKQTIDALSYQNKLYAIPRDASNLVIFYNKDIFDRYNIKYPDKNWKINDFITVSKKLTKDNIWGFGSEYDMYYVMPFITTMKENIYDKNILEGNAIILFNNLSDKYHVMPTKSDIGSRTVAQMFLDEQIAMHLSGRWLYPKYNEDAKFRWGIVKFPGITSCDASGWAISKQSKHKQEAIKFVRYLSSKENIVKMTKSGLIVPARNDIQFNDKEFLDAVNSSVPVKITTKYNKIIDKYNDELFNQ